MRTTALRFVMIALSLTAGCDAQPNDDDSEQYDENDDTVGTGEGGKADGTSASTYRSGCGAPIRTGKYALKGDVVGPLGVKLDSYVVVDGEKIVAVQASAPMGVTVIDTGGVIFPGLIDGHGHVEYNHIPLADLGKRYQDRDQWPNAKLYQTLVKAPKNAVTAAGLQCEALRHGEARALVGGTTGIQGTPATACASGSTRGNNPIWRAPTTTSSAIPSATSPASSR